MFKKGQSGNPAGKPPGARHKINVWVDGVLQDAADKTLNALMAKVEEGDTAAIKMVLDRISPIRKGRPIRHARAPGRQGRDAEDNHGGRRRWRSDTRRGSRRFQAGHGPLAIRPGEAVEIDKLAATISRRTDGS
jgi:hypothetical protein